MLCGAIGVVLGSIVTAIGVIFFFFSFFLFTFLHTAEGLLLTP